jgi:hypothetical protein
MYLELLCLKIYDLYLDVTSKSSCVCIKYEYYFVFRYQFLKRQANAYR